MRGSVSQCPPDQPPQAVAASGCEKLCELNKNNKERTMHFACCFNQIPSVLDCQQMFFQITRR